MYVFEEYVTGNLFCIIYESVKSWPVLRDSSDTSFQDWWIQFGHIFKGLIHLSMDSPMGRVTEARYASSYMMLRPIVVVSRIVYLKTMDTFLY